MFLLIKKFLIIGSSLTLSAGGAYLLYAKKINTASTLEAEKKEKLKKEAEGEEEKEEEPEKEPDYSSYEKEEFMQTSATSAGTTTKTNKTPKDVLKGYLKTLTGAKTLAETQVKLIFEKIFNDPKIYPSSAVQTLLNNHKDNKITQLDTELKRLKDEKTPYKAKIALDKKYVLNGATDELYRKNLLYEDYKGAFVNQLNQNFNVYVNGGALTTYNKTTHDSEKAKYEYEGITANTSTSTGKKTISLFGKSIVDPLKKDLSAIWNFVFEDWIAKNKPLLVQKYSWHYASTFKDPKYTVEESSKALVTVPTIPNYNWPAFTEATNKKFKAFAEGLDEITTKTWSDINDEQQVYDVITIDNPEATSQAAIAALYLRDRVKVGAPAGIPNPDCATSVKGSECPVPDTKCKDKKTGKEATDIGDKDDILKNFCIDKTASISDTKPTTSDFYFVNKEKDGSTTKWVLYRDALGVSAISQNPKVTIDATNGDKNLKTHLLSAALAKHHNLADQQEKFVLRKALKDHLDANFEALILKFFLTKCATEPAKDAPCPCDCDGCSAQKDQACTCTTDDATYCDVCLTKALIDLLEEEKKIGKLHKQRKLLLKDYMIGPILGSMGTVDSSDASSVEKAKILSKGFAANFPECIKWDKAEEAGSKPEGIKDKKLIPCLEKIYLGSTASADCATTDTDYVDTITPLLTCYNKLIDKLFAASSDVTSTHTIYKNNTIYTFTSSTKVAEVQTPTKVSDLKKFNKPDLLNLALLTAIKNNTIGKYLTFQQHSKHIKSFDVENKKYKTDVADTDFLGNKEKILEWIKKYEATSTGTSTSNPTTTNIQKLLINSLVYANNYGKLMQYDRPFEYNSWDKSIADLESLNKVLKNLDYEGNHIVTSNFFDDLHEAKLNVLKQLETALYLMSNNFDQYREHTHKSMTGDLAAYTFTLQYEPKLCSKTQTTDITKDSLGSWKVKDRFQSIINFTQSCQAKSDATDDTCVDLYDTYSFSQIKNTAQGTTNKVFDLPGYKGLVHQGNTSTTPNLPSSFWADFTSFMDGKKELKTNYVGSLYAGNATSKTFIFDSGQKKYLSYVITAKKDDFSNTQKFTNLMDSLTPDILFKDALNLARNPEIQKEAFKNHSLMGLWTSTKDSRKYFDQITLGDARLKHNINTTWININ